jgi:hypothetical protein
MGGADQAGPDDDSAGDGVARRWSSSEAVTSRGAEQKLEAGPSSVAADSNQLLTRRREPAMGLPKLYIRAKIRQVLTKSTRSLDLEKQLPVTDCQGP